MIAVFYIVIGWTALSLILAPILIPFLVRRLAMNKVWFTEPPNLRESSSVTPHVRMTRR
jgi:hypothetical protein